MSGTAQNDQKFKNDLVRLGKAHILTSVQDTIHFKADFWLAEKIGLLVLF